MELTQFISYLDYGVLGLSAIILILSFVLLSREQKRDIFRPEVASAIRKYMMLAMVFAGIGLVSTIVEGVMVKPAKEEKKVQEERMDLLSELIAKEMSERLKSVDSLITNETIEPIEPVSVDPPKANDPKDTIVPKPKSKPQPTEKEKIEIISDAIIAPYDEYIGSPTIKRSLNIVGEKNEIVKKNAEALLDNYEKGAKVKEDKKK